MPDPIARATPIVALLVSLVISPRASGVESDARPNIVFFLVDDLGWRDLRCFGSPFYDTPHLDRLATTGVRFTEAYAAAPVCSPTRASILTGLKVENHVA